MNWKNIKLKGKLTIAFGFLISIMIGAGIWAISGFNTIISNAEEVIDGNNLRYELNQRYVDHLVWTTKLNKLLTDANVTEIDIETDYRNCKFGKWYYGEGRKKDEETTPELKSIFEQFEQPHKNLHNSASKILNLYKQRDWDMALIVKQAEVDHLLWMDNIKNVVYLKRNNASEIANNTTLYNFNKLINSDGFKKLKRENLEISTLLSNIEKSHRELSQASNVLLDQLSSNRINNARSQFQNELVPVSNKTLKNLTELSNWFNAGLKEMEEAKQIYANETMANMDKLQVLFSSAIENSKAHITNDRAMITQANDSKNNIFISIIFVSIIATILAALVSNSIINPLQKSVSFANNVAKGDLTASVDLDQKDEVGELANSLRRMITKLKEIISNIKEGSDKIACASKELSTGALQISSGVSEQAASAEEVSSSMEQMASNIQQNSAHALQTKEIAGKSSVAVKNVVNASSESMEAVREIFDKINIVVEIAEKTDLLAINAAVEAARAGEQGRGFAVVAAEVRKLAERSQNAANEIVSLAQNGMKLTEQSNEMLNSIVPDIQETSRLIEEIATASREQEAGVDQVNVSIQQLSMVTQQNASASEEMASNSEELSIQADDLDKITEYFTVEASESWRNKSLSKNDNERMNNAPGMVNTHKQTKSQEFNMENFEVETADHEVF